MKYLQEFTLKNPQELVLKDAYENDQHKCITKNNDKCITNCIVLYVHKYLLYSLGCKL